MVLHPKIQALRNSVGYVPIHHFYPNKQKWEEKPIEIRAPKSSDRTIKMYHCIFGVPDDYGTVPVKGCFAKSLEERGPNSKGNFKIVVLWQHIQSDPIGTPKVLIEDEVGLYAEYEPDDVPSGNRAILQVRSGTINQGSYGFNYVWDKMEYDDNTGLILMKECSLFEISPVTIGAQKETHAIRSSTGIYIDEYLEEETEDFIKLLPRKQHLEIRSLISRHISLARLQPTEPTEQTLQVTEPKQEGIDYNYLISKLNF